MKAWCEGYVRDTNSLVCKYENNTAFGGIVRPLSFAYHMSGRNGKWVILFEVLEQEKVMNHGICL